MKTDLISLEETDDDRLDVIDDSKEKRLLQLQDISNDIIEDIQKIKRGGLEFDKIKNSKYDKLLQLQNVSKDIQKIKDQDTYNTYISRSNNR